MNTKKRLISLLAVILSLVMLLPVTAEASEYPYYELTDEIVLPDGGYNLNTDYIGIKTIYVNKALFGTTSDRYGYDTANGVKKFQEKNNLEVTGEVNLETWLKLGYSEEEWYGLGTYTHPVLTTRYSTREDIVNAMLTAARENAEEGTIYRVGSSGPAGTYTDCSGLIFQCLYAAGINIEKNIVDHALAEYEYTSRNMEADEKLGVRIDKSDIEPGDLVFYQYNGRVCHVGILTGNGKMYDSWPEKGVTHRNYSSGGNILCFKRVLPDYDEYHESPDNAITGRNLCAGSNSCILFEDPETLVEASGYDLLVLVSAENRVEKITLNKDLTVPEGGFVLGATGDKAQWLLDNGAIGDVLAIDEYLITVTEYVEPVAEEPVTEEPISEETKKTEVISVTKGNETDTKVPGLPFIFTLFGIVKGE